MVRSVMDSLIDKGRVDRGYLGVMIQNLDDGLASSFGYEGTRGALVGDVTQNGPAAAAGLQAGDILLRYDGSEVSDIDHLRLMVANTEPDRRVPIEFLRDGHKQSVEVRIGRLESTEGSPVRADSHSADLGFDVRPLTPDQAREGGLDLESGGVVVTQLDPLGAAARCGLRLNDVIVRVQDTEVSGVADLQRALDASDLDAGVRLTVLTEGGRRFVFLRAPR
jgi:serine protease Do